MGRVLAVTNQKGGVGKTTTSINLSASLAATRKKVLLIDLDPQGNATMGSGIDKNSLQYSGFEWLTQQATASDVILSTGEAGYDLLPGHGDLTAAEVKLLGESRRERRLLESLHPILDQYDFILIDCPPALNVLTLNALVAAHGVIIPMQCEYYALEGLSALIRTIRDIQSTINKALVIEGVLRTMYDPRNRLSQDVSAQLVEHFGEKLYRTVVPRNVRLAEAPGFGKPIMYYDPYSKGAKAYLALAGELLRRNDRRQREETT